MLRVGFSSTTTDKKSVSKGRKSDKVEELTWSGLFNGRTSVGPLTLLRGQLAFEQGASLVIVGALEAPRFAFANNAWVIFAACDAARTRIINL